MFRRRRPLLRAAAVGGAAYYAGKKVQEGRDQDAVEGEAAYAEGQEEQPAPGLSEEAVKRLEDLAALKEKGVLTQAEFDAEKQKILNP
jgi:hypothetical protein